jgi:hypothetical protein
MGKAGNDSNALKAKMIHCLTENKGNVTNASKAVGIAPKTHYEWCKNDDDYKTEVDAVLNVAIDYVENKLFERIEQGDTTATIFYLKTIGKRRGYVERAEVTGKDGKDLIPEKADLSKLSKDELKQMAAIEKKLYAK